MLVLTSVLLSAGIDALTYLKNIVVFYWYNGKTSDSKEEIFMEINSQKEFECTLDDYGLRFWPPLYIQRYITVKEIVEHPIWNGSIKKVVDFGCAELSFFKYMKQVPGLNNIMLIDVNFSTLDVNLPKIMPLIYDHVYMSERKEPLTVDVYNGSIADLDDRMLGLDAVICIELIEHLHSDVLIAVPATVFGFIKPKLAVFTTPNVEFNILFPNFTTEFRHDDHKFEWTRKQFQNWACDITLAYPDYAVQFNGIGAGPLGSEKLGCCSQMAIFYRKDMNTSPANQVGSTPYKLLRRVSYPFEQCDENTIKERTVLDKLIKFVSEASSKKEYLVRDNMEIPLRIIMPYVSDCCSSIEDLESIVRKLFHTEINKNGEWIMKKVISECSSGENISDSDSMSNHSGQENSLLENSVNNQQCEDDWDKPMGMNLSDSKLRYSTPMSKNQGIHLNNVDSFNTQFSNSELDKMGVDYNKSSRDMEISSSCNSSLNIDDCNVYQDFVLGRNSSNEDISETEKTVACVPNSNEFSNKSDEINDNITDDNTVVHNSKEVPLKSNCSSDTAHEIISFNFENFSSSVENKEVKEIGNQSLESLNFGNSKLCYSTPMNKNQEIYLSNVDSFNTQFSNSELYKTAVDYNKSSRDMEISSSCNSSLNIDDCNVYQDFVLGRNSSNEDISETEKTVACVSNTNELFNKSDEINDNITDDCIVIHDSSEVFLRSNCSSNTANEIKFLFNNLSNGVKNKESKEINNSSQECLNRTLLDESGFTENMLSTTDKTC